MDRDPPRVNQYGGNLVSANINIEGQESGHSGGAGKYTTPKNSWVSPLQVDPAFNYEAEEPFSRLQTDPRWFRMAHYREGHVVPDSGTQKTAVLFTPQEPYFAPATIPVVEDATVVDHAVYYSDKQQGMNETAIAGLKKFGQNVRRFDKDMPTDMFPKEQKQDTKPQKNSNYVDLLSSNDSRRVYNVDRYHFQQNIAKSRERRALTQFHKND